MVVQNSLSATPAETRNELNFTNSRTSFKRALNSFPDGTTRSTIERDPSPIYAKSGQGCYLTDVDGNRFLDLNCNFTTLIHGHRFAPVTQALKEQLDTGTCFANPTDVEVKLAEEICRRIPSVERVRFVNTGTEAVMFCVKAARAFTGREKIAKIEGAYHGAYDWVEVSQSPNPDNWGPETAPNAVLLYPGMPRSVVEETVVLPFNNAEAATRLIIDNADKLAAVLIDPMPSRGGLVSPDPGYIDAVQTVCREHGIVIVADEVLNLRQGYQGASARYGLTPDIMAMGKIIGGGLPIGAIGGNKDIMEVFSSAKGKPAIPQGGTFSANPLSMVAGMAALNALDQAAFDRLEALGNSVRARLAAAIESTNAPFCVTGAASLFRIHPRKDEPRNFRDTYLDAESAMLMRRLGRHFLRNGILLPFGAAASLSTPCGHDEVDMITNVFSHFLEEYGNDFNH